MTEPQQPALTAEEQAAVDAGTHVIDPVFGFQPRVPLDEDGNPVGDAPSTGATVEERLQTGQDAAADQLQQVVQPELQPEQPQQ